MKNINVDKVDKLFLVGKYDDACDLLVIMNNDYRKGEPKMSDGEWDAIYNMAKSLNPNHSMFNSSVITEIISAERKEKLPYPMYSLDSVKSVKELQKKIKNKGLPSNINVIILSKYDGCSSLSNENNDECWSRGDGNEGQRLSEHYKSIGYGKKLKTNDYTIGELIINRKLFAENQHLLLKKDGSPYKNPRNMVAGLINEDVVNPYWKYVSHIRYGIANADSFFSLDKLEQLKLLPEIPYLEINADEITEELLDDLYYKWSEEWEIDGLVIDVNDKNVRKSLGRERNNNPAYAWSYKKGWVTPTKTFWIDDEWNISKNGYIKPVILINPVQIEGVTVSRATAYNAKFVLDKSIGKGWEGTVIRGGSVIPKLISTTKKGEINPPTECPSCHCELVWNKNNVELMCINPDCKEVNFKKMAFFFTSFELDDFGEGIAQLIFNAGFDTVAKVLSMNINNLQSISGLGSLSGNKFLKGIEDKIRTTTFEKLGHASGCFENLGSRKLKMILDGLGLTYDEVNEKMSLNNGVGLLSFQNSLLDIKGVSHTTAAAFMDGLVEFREFIKDLNIKIVNKVERIKTQTNNTLTLKNIDLKGKAFLFTGIRDAALEEYILNNGGEIKSSYSKKVTDLIVKDNDFTSNKVTDAKNDGANVIAIEDFKKTLLSD